LALVDVGADERPPDARRHVPVHGARVVALGVLADAVELDAGPAEDRCVRAGHQVGEQPSVEHVDPPHLLEDFREGGVAHGTGTASRTWPITCSDVRPSASASYVVSTRWRSTSAATDFTSCGVTNARPPRNARARAACVSAIDARGDAP